MRGSCCDPGFSPRTLARHVALSVGGSSITTSVAQPANKHAAAIINIRYRIGLSSFELVADRLRARVFRWCPYSSSRFTAHDRYVGSSVHAAAGRPSRRRGVSVSLRRLIGGLRRRGIGSVPPPPTQGQEKRSRVCEAVGLGLHPRDHGLLVGLLGTQQR